LSTGCYPDKWRTSYVCLIFKAGNRHDTNNDRSISRFSTLPKILENMIAPKLAAAFNNIISDNQHGFRYAKSSIINLLVYYTNIVSIVSKGRQVYAVYTDIIKTLDSVDLAILLKKLEYNGISG
jgi:hypothetical protein